MNSFLKPRSKVSGNLSGWLFVAVCLAADVRLFRMSCCKQNVVTIFGVNYREFFGERNTGTNTKKGECHANAIQP
jgi:hypothetical protein